MASRQQLLAGQGMNIGHPVAHLLFVGSDDRSRGFQDQQKVLDRLAGVGVDRTRNVANDLRGRIKTLMGDFIQNGVVPFMTDTGEHRNAEATYGIRNRLIIQSVEIGDRAAAADDAHGIEVLTLVYIRAQATERG